MFSSKKTTLPAKKNPASANSKTALVFTQLAVVNVKTSSRFIAPDTFQMKTRIAKQGSEAIHIKMSHGRYHPEKSGLESATDEPQDGIINSAMNKAQAAVTITAKRIK